MVESDKISRNSATQTAAWAFLNQMLRSRGMRGFSIEPNGLPRPLQVVSTVSFLLQRVDSAVPAKYLPPSDSIENSLHKSKGHILPVTVACSKVARNCLTDLSSGNAADGSLADDAEMLRKQVELLSRQNAALEQALETMEKIAKVKDAAMNEVLAPSLANSAYTENGMHASRHVSQEPRVFDDYAETEQAGNTSQINLGSLHGSAYVQELDRLLQQLQVDKHALKKPSLETAPSGAGACVGSCGSSKDGAAKVCMDMGGDYGDVDDAGAGGINLQKCLKRSCAIVFRKGIAFLPDDTSSDQENEELIHEEPDALPGVLEHWLTELKRLAGLEDLVLDISKLLQDSGADAKEAEDQLQLDALGHSEILAKIRRLCAAAADAKAADGVIALALLAERAGGPNMLHVELVKHFQLLFNCEVLEGVLSCMNKVYLEVQAARNFKQTVASALGIDSGEEQWSEAAMAAWIEHLAAKR